MANPFGLTVERRSNTEYHLMWERTRDAKIFRSTEKGGGFEEIANPSNVSQYTDEPTQRPKSRVTYYYKVELYDASDNLEDTLGPERTKPQPVDPGAFYVRRQARRHLKRVGQKCYLFEQNESGDRCSECWDEHRRVRTRKDCNSCDGSGFVNGWSDPLPLNISFSLEQVKPQPTQGGKLDTQQLNAHTSAAPRVSIGDYIVRERDKEVFEVLKQQPSRKGPHILRQNVILKMVEKGSAARTLTSEIPS